MGFCKNITGQKFGILLAKKQIGRDKWGHPVWLCKCDCGQSAEVTINHLTSGHTKSCGCLKGKRRDLTGQKFGRWFVVKWIRTPPGKASIWLCKCDCGNISEVRTDQLISGASKSCGCLQKEVARKQGQENPNWAGQCIKVGEENFNWKGEDVGYIAAHTWLAKNKPRPEFCERCRIKPAAELSYNGKNGEWSRNSEDYEWLCASCHSFKDNGSGIILTQVKIQQIREWYAGGKFSQRKIGRLVGVSHCTIGDIVNYKGAYENI